MGSTHFVFDGKQVQISPDLGSIVTFLQGIEQETTSLLKDDSTSMKYLRSKMICLFASLETLLCLHIAYSHNTSDEGIIVGVARKGRDRKSFLDTYCLASGNEWVKNNKDRAKYIKSDDLIKMRNSLTHFYSIKKSLSIGPQSHASESRKIEKRTGFKVVFISPEDLSEIIQDTFMLMMKKWSTDCLAFHGKSDEFKERILKVRNLIDNEGAKTLIFNVNRVSG